jgi:hypothetical protein
VSEQPFERYPALASWIERLGNTKMDLGLGEWMVFVGAINAALQSSEARIKELEGERDDLMKIERLAFEASQWAKDPAHNIGADPPSLVFARRFAFLMQGKSNG